MIPLLLLCTIIIAAANSLPVFAEVYTPETIRASLQISASDTRYTGNSRVIGYDLGNDGSFLLLYDVDNHDPVNQAIDWSYSVEVFDKNGDFQYRLKLDHAGAVRARLNEETGAVSILPVRVDCWVDLDQFGKITEIHEPMEADQTIEDFNTYSVNGSFEQAVGDRRFRFDDRSPQEVQLLDPDGTIIFSLVHDVRRVDTNMILIPLILMIVFSVLYIKRTGNARKQKNKTGGGSLS